MEREQLTKKYYKIAEVAEMEGLTIPTLRYWESQFRQLKPKRNDGGTRFYTADDVETVRVIKFLLKEKGLKIEAAKSRLAADQSGVYRRHRAIATLRDARNRLQELLHSLSSRNHPPRQ